MNDRHGRDGQGFGFLRQSVVLGLPLEQRDPSENHQDNHYANKNGEEAPALIVLVPLMFSFHRNSVSPSSRNLRFPYHIEKEFQGVSAAGDCASAARRCLRP